LITILHTESSQGWGGQERRTIRELTSLSRERFRPLLACRPGSKIGEKALARGLEVEYVNIRGNFDPIAVVHFMKLYRRCSVDIVHTHSTADSWSASTAGKLSPRRPVVVRTRHLSCSFNNRMIYNFMADQVITVGESTRQYMIQEKGIDEHRVLTIPTGVDLAEFDPERIRENLRAELGIDPDAPVLGTIAVLRNLKGHRYLLAGTQEIVRSCPRAKLLLVGEGPQEKNLRRLIAEYGISSAVIMPGFREDIPRVLNTLDVFVFPSLQEALGTAVLEAMAMKKPVVATRVGGIPEVVQEGDTGYLVEPGNPGAIAEKVIPLLQDKDLGRKMGIQGRRTVEAHYDNRLMVQRIEQLYQRLMEKRKA
jgi:glycosyltransferase involved in cell wall biosynthesis